MSLFYTDFITGLLQKAVKEKSYARFRPPHFSGKTVCTAPANIGGLCGGPAPDRGLPRSILRQARYGESAGASVGRDDAVGPEPM